MPMVLDVDGSQWIRMDYDMTGWMMRPTRTSHIDLHLNQIAILIDFRFTTHHTYKKLRPLSALILGTL